MFAYDEATNTVEATEGTEGTPLTFDDFVDADRAGTAELLPAITCTTDHTLTYQIRPVEALAIQISFILSGTSAGAGDTLDITGTDWDGNAQSENIDVSAGDGTYNGAYKWRTITDIDCTGWADGTLQVTQDRWGVIWDYGLGNYQVDAYLEIGNYSTPTYFTSKNEVCVITVELDVRGNATLQLGEKVGDWSRNGSTFIFNNPSNRCEIWYGNFYMYSSTLKFINLEVDIQISDNNNVEILNSNILGNDKARDFYLTGSMNSLILKRIFVSGMRYGLRLDLTPDTMEDIYIHDCDFGIRTTTSVIAIGADVTNCSYDYYVYFGGDSITTINPVNPVSNPRIYDDGAWIKEQYHCNIHIADKDGTDLQNATVLCEDKDDNEIFSVSTDASGDIVEQTITYKKWEDEAVTLTEYSPHKFTISKAGYETIVMDNITVDGKIDWTMELLPVSGRTKSLIATEIYKDTSNQKMAVFAINTVGGDAKTGDAANITAQISIDGGVTAATNDTNPTELDATNAPGIYLFDLSQAETNGDTIILAAGSSTPNIQLSPIMITTKSYKDRLLPRHHGI